MMAWRGGRALDWNNIITLAGVGIGTCIAAFIGYSKKWPAKPPVDPVLAGVGFELGNREQSKQIVDALTRIAVALEILADKRTDEIEQIHRSLLDRLDAQERREEQEEARPRPFRRRKPTGQ